MNVGSVNVRYFYRIHSHGECNQKQSCTCGDINGIYYGQVDVAGYVFKWLRGDLIIGQSPAVRSL